MSYELNNDLRATFLEVFKDPLSNRVLIFSETTIFFTSELQIKGPQLRELWVFRKVKFIHLFYFQFQLVE